MDTPGNSRTVIAHGGIYLDCAIIHKPKLSNSDNGDAYFISPDAPWFLMIADGLGAGNKARETARVAVSLAQCCCLESPDQRKESLLSFITTCHQKLKRSRGAAVAVVVLDRAEKKLSFCGIGNIRLVLAGSSHKSFCCQPGIVGVKMPRKICVTELDTNRYATGFFFSDGISVRSVLRAAQDPHRPLNIIANEIEELNGNSDDQTLIVFSLYD